MLVTVQPLGQLTNREENCSNTFEAQSSNNVLTKHLTNTELMTRKKITSRDIKDIELQRFTSPFT